MNRRLAIAVAVSFGCLMAGACVPLPYIVIDGPYTGQVIELETGEPIEGAVVAAEWLVNYGLSAKCCYKETITDKNGEFELPAVICITPVYSAGATGLEHARFVIFKPGYLGYPPLKSKKSLYTGVKFNKYHRHNVVKLDKVATLGERSQTLDKVTSFTFFGDEPKKVIFERELPYLFNLTKQEREYLEKAWKPIREKYQEEFVVPPVQPPITNPSIEKQPN
ncbi:MAG: hypothetical protein HQL06_06440 [Nitrospirae bacterium]|nr:hypothetical protein [Nitrospirota bacterium]